MYTDEYFQIEQMNNQLINSQRALMKSNKKLQSLLAEIRQASNAIAILEQDDLTALCSASAFYRRVEKCIQEHPDQVYDIIALDIERFKLVNEIYGRVSGDRMLKSLALTHILNTLREDGFLSKWMISVPESLRFPWLLKCLSIF